MDQVGMDHVRVHPKFLHSNATSHKWALGAFAELLDNSLDEVFYGSTFVNVDMLENKKDGSRMLVIEGTPTDSGPTTTPLPDKKLLAFILDRLQKKDIFVVCGSKNCFSSVWRWDLKAMSCFYLGRLEDTLTLVEKLEQIDYSSQKFQGTTPESLGAFAATVRGLLCHRAEGIKAFKSGRHSEAVEHYNSALACTSCSRPFAAICLYDRSASHQALGRTREAIKDCKKAAEMDPSSRDIQIRAAGCHLALGELEEALKYYKCLLQQDSDKCLESDQVIEASKGLQKAQVLDDCPGDLSFWYRHISKGAWPFSTADHGWPISDCTSEGLKSWEKTVDCYSPGKGLMPASFKVRTVPLDGDNGAFEEHLSKL